MIKIVLIILSVGYIAYNVGRSDQMLINQQPETAEVTVYQFFNGKQFKCKLYDSQQ